MKPFPWTEAMGFGFGVLHLPPAQFWAMTPRELAAVLRWQMPKLEAAPSRDELMSLMARFPDQ